LSVKTILQTFLCCLLIVSYTCAAEPSKPIVAVFPLGGTSAKELRDRLGFSMRTKLDRDGKYVPLDGPAMLDMADESKTPITFDTSATSIESLANGSGAVVLVWGEVVPNHGKDLLRLRMLDLRVNETTINEYEAEISDPTDVRFVVEKFLATLPGVSPFEHPDELAVHHAPASDALFRTNPNLVIDGDFASPGHWEALFGLEKYGAELSDLLPLENKVIIYRQSAGNALTMKMTKKCAETVGLACLSDAISIQPRVRYRLGFRYLSDGPVTHVFVKGYALGRSIAGEPEDREVYRLQVPPGEATGDQWQTVEADVNPRSPAAVVQRLRMDLYAYLKPGTIRFSDVTLKAVGREDNGKP